MLTCCFFSICRIPSDDLAYLVDINTKDLYKLCQKLREDRLITSYGFFTLDLSMNILVSMGFVLGKLY